MTVESDYKKYRTWFTLFLVFLLAGFLIGALAYNGQFNLYRDPFSDLGASETPEGKDNHASMAIFVVNMAITAIIFSRIAVMFARDATVPFRGFRVLFSITAAMGACIATFPNNIFLAQHQLGAGFLVGSLWMHANFFIADASRATSKMHGFFLQLLLQSTVLTYAVAFVVQAPNRDTIQKFAITGLALAIELSLASLCKVSVPDTDTADEGEVNGTKLNH